MPPTAKHREKFRLLKKGMGQTFGRIRRALAAGLVPERADVGAFVEQARLMTSYPGFGDDAYPDLLAACEALAQTSATGDGPGMAAALQALLALQARCHQAGGWGAATTPGQRL